MSTSSTTQRRHERTSYRPHELIAAAIDNVVNYSALPLRLLAYGGFLTSATAIILAMFYLVKYLVGDIRVMGFTTLVILLLFFHGTDDVRLRHRGRISHSHRLGRRAAAALCGQADFSFS